jgi:hypothetical protein
MEAAWVGVVIVAGTFGIAATIMQLRRHWIRLPIETVQITGAVVRQNRHPDQQSPIANVAILATGGWLDQEGESNGDGFFQLKVHPGFLRSQPIHLSFTHEGYKPAEIASADDKHIYVVRMEPLIADLEPSITEKPKLVANVRVRYTLRSETTMNVGNLAKRFDVVNIANIPCGKNRPCSPDGKWKANVGGLSLDADQGNQFQDVRVTCIAGPCAFTAITSSNSTFPSKTIHVSALNWSDTAAFLVEGEITRTVITESTRRFLPAIVGRTLTYALPPGAEGLALEATLNGEAIVFPLGPRAMLSWATCNVEVAPNRTSTYRCELKPDYMFPE